MMTAPSVPPARASRNLVVALAIGVVLGGLTDAGQTWLPWTTNSLANSGGSWVLVSFLVALASRAVARAAAAGGACMLGLVVGYYLAAALRGVAVASSSVQFWVVAALVIGPLVGLAAGWVRFGSPQRVAVGAGVVGGLLMGEAVHGLRYLDQSTSPTYWAAEMAVGLGVMAGLVTWRARQLPAAAVTVLTAGTVAATTIGLYLCSF